jgi:hypothetical protein
MVTAPGPLPLAESAQRADARIPAVVGHYTLGAYVDPDNELIRHEAHAIQRLEAESRWDLRPITPLAATNPAPDSRSDCRGRRTGRAVGPGQAIGNHERAGRDTSSAVCAAAILAGEVQFARDCGNRAQC